MWCAGVVAEVVSVNSFAKEPRPMSAPSKHTFRLRRMAVAVLAVATMAFAAGSASAATPPATPDTAAAQFQGNTLVVTTPSGIGKVHTMKVSW